MSKTKPFDINNVPMAYRFGLPYGSVGKWIMAKEKTDMSRQSFNLFRERYKSLPGPVLEVLLACVVAGTLDMYAANTLAGMLIEKQITWLENVGGSGI